VKAALNAINQRIVDFADWKSKVTLANIIAWSGGAIGLAVSFSGGFDWIVPRVLVHLTGKPELAAAWPTGDHWGLKALVSLLILGFFYFFVFSVQATVLLSERQTAPDYRVELMRAIGVNFTKVRDYYDVKNTNGDCHVILEADFQISDLPIAHIERKFSSSTATARTALSQEAHVSTSKASIVTELKQIAKEWIYHFRFKPPLADSAATCQTKITEEMIQGVSMYIEDVQDDPVLGGKLEAIGHLVQEPTDQLELEVEFPYRYLVSSERFFKVRLGSTETPHQREEERLTRDKSLDARIQNGRQTLSLVVSKPILGLCYYLCWVPPNKPRPKELLSSS
jgi:hypothetical protein